jgi:hypothetical protein
MRSVEMNEFLRGDDGPDGLQGIPGRVYEDAVAFL